MVWRLRTQAVSGEAGGSGLLRVNSGSGFYCVGTLLKSFMWNSNVKGGRERCGAEIQARNDGCTRAGVALERVE